MLLPPLVLCANSQMYLPCCCRPLYCAHTRDFVRVCPYCGYCGVSTGNSAHAPDCRAICRARTVHPLNQSAQNIVHFPHWLTFSFDRGSYELDEPIHVEVCRGGALFRAIAAYLRRKEARMVQLVVLCRTNTLVHWS